MEKIKGVFSGDKPEEETSIVDDLWKNSTLSWSTRIKGFALLFVLGFIMSILASFFFWIGIGGITLFAVLYTVGNVCSMCSTLFLMGPVNQMKKMFAATRLIATIVLLVAFGLTLMSALWLKNAALVMLFVVIQFFALLWYSLSYIPFARDAVKKIFGSVMDV